MKPELTQLKSYPADTVIFREGDAASAAFILTQGRVEISISDGSRSIVMAELEPVSVFGEMALLSRDGRRTATVRTLTATKAVLITRDDFTSYVDASPVFIRAVLQALVERLRQTRTLIMGSNDILISVAELVTMMAERHQTGIRESLFAAHAARALGIDVARVTDALDVFERAHLLNRIDDGEGTFAVPDPGGFMDRAMRVHQAVSLHAAAAGMTTGLPG